MNSDEYIESMILPFEPKLPFEPLVEEVNTIFHSVEAATYDARHPEIQTQLPGVWKSMIGHILARHPQMQWDFLDFGCGTGFATQQILSNVPREAIRSVICYDPCPDMVEQAKKGLEHSNVQIHFSSNLNDLSSLEHKFSVLATNAVLHHLPRPLQAIDCLTPYLGDKAVWLCGHEPSRRYYRNPNCASVLNAYKAARKWSRFFDSSRYADRIGKLLGLRVDPVSFAAREAHRKGLFARRPSNTAIALLVDLHVAHNTQEAESGRGFDFREMEMLLSTGWSLDWHCSYSFLGPFWEGSAHRRWQEQCRRLNHEFPDDGANFCSIWTRKLEAASVAA